MSNLEPALRYASRHIPVLPAHWPLDDLCSCGRPECSSPAKHPLTRHGLTDASTDPRQITAWWERWPDANIAARTGSVSQIGVVLEVDVEHQDGFASLRELSSTMTSDPLCDRSHTARWPTLPLPPSRRRGSQLGQPARPGWT